MLSARQWMAQDAVKSFSRQFGREPMPADIAAIEERLGLIQETLARINADLASRRIDDWLRMPGGVEPGRAPGPRWSKESADYYGGAGRGGGRGERPLAAVAGGAPAKEPFQPGRLHSAAARVVDVANIPTGALAGADGSYLVTHAGPLGARHLDEYKNALAAGARALSDYPTEINRVRNEVLPVVDNIDNLRAALGPIDHPVAGDAFSLMARMENQGRDFGSIKQAVDELLQSPAAKIVNNLRTNSVWAREGITGPHISSVAAGEGLSQREEQVVSRIFEGLPVYRETQRASTVMLNKLRSDVTDAFVNQLKKKGDPTYVDSVTRRLTQAGRNEAQHYANQVSRMTGWGDLGPLENFADLLRGPLFSARYTSSLAERVAGLNPLATGHPFGPAWRQAEIGRA